MSLSHEQKKSINTEETHTKRHDEDCSKYEGAYTKIFFMVLCALSACIFIICISDEEAMRRIPSRYWMFKIANILAYILFPVITYVLLELILYMMNGIKPTVILYKDHLKINQNRFGIFNYNIKYTNIDRIENNTVYGTSFCCIYLKEPLEDACFTEFKPNCLLASVNRIVFKKLSNKHKVGITTSSFGKKAYESLCAELIRRMNTLQQAERR